MSDIAEKLAEQSANDVLIIEEVGEVVNTEGYITNEGVHQKPHGQERAQFSPIFWHPKVNQSYQHKSCWYQDGNGVEKFCEFFLRFLRLSFRGVTNSEVACV